MLKDRAFASLEGAALAGLVSILLGAAVYISLAFGWASGPAAPAASTQALNLVALPVSIASPTSVIPTLPPEWTAAPFPTRAAPTASQPALAPLNVTAPAGPLPSATLPGVDAGSPTNAPAASSASPPATTASQPSATSQPSTTNVPGPGGIGRRVEVGSFALTVMGVSKQEDSGSVYLVVDVVLENVSQEQATYELVCFSLVDSGDLFYDAADDAPAPSLLEGELARGSEVRGHVAFYLEPETHGLTFFFTPLLFSDDSQSIQVSLGQ